ncbi:hypothetical protein A3K79_00090 [Candidatus Bathyarchaeota archaeon RBG_13_46_16b]|nr:MAG: hypothetical protein A3K79_00090 [Candidatus Bathyarchaeota archaeon RBG_13_46_16b]
MYSFSFDNMVSVIIKRGVAERYSARDEEKGLRSDRLRLSAVSELQAKANSAEDEHERAEREAERCQPRGCSPRIQDDRARLKTRS